MGSSPFLCSSIGSYAWDMGQNPQFQWAMLFYPIILTLFVKIIQHPFKRVKVNWKKYKQIL